MFAVVPLALLTMEDMDNWHLLLPVNTKYPLMLQLGGLLGNIEYRISIVGILRFIPPIAFIKCSPLTENAIV